MVFAKSPQLILNGDDSPPGQRRHPMPIFEYICKQCDHEFEAIVYGGQKAECPKCKSKQLAAQLSVFAVAGKGPSSAAPSAGGGCGSCGDPRGPGSCSRPN
jgi:putative FmdB family regulatory protein